MNTAFPEYLRFYAKERWVSARKRPPRNFIYIFRLCSPITKRRIRECGLEFVVRVANYYHVSCITCLDGLLIIRAMIAVDEIRKMILR